jgi:hypothetical protein
MFEPKPIAEIQDDHHTSAHKGTNTFPFAQATACIMPISAAMASGNVVGVLPLVLLGRMDG